MQQHSGAKKIGRCWKVMVGFENGVFQVECLAMIADPMGTLSKLLKCDSFLRPVFQLEVGRKQTNCIQILRWAISFSAMHNMHRAGIELWFKKIVSLYNIFSSFINQRLSSVQISLDVLTFCFVIGFFKKDFFFSPWTSPWLSYEVSFISALWIVSSGSWKRLYPN